MRLNLPAKIRLTRPEPHIRFQVYEGSSLPFTHRPSELSFIARSDSMPKSRWSPAEWDLRNERLCVEGQPHVIMMDKPEEGYQAPYCNLCKSWADETHLASERHANWLQWEEDCERLCAEGHPYIIMCDKPGTDYKDPYYNLCKGWAQPWHCSSIKHTKKLDWEQWKSQARSQQSQSEPQQTQSQQTPQQQPSVEAWLSMPSSMQMRQQSPSQLITASPEGAPAAVPATTPAAAPMPATEQEMQRMLDMAFESGFNKGLAKGKSKGKVEDDVGEDGR